MTPTLKLLHDRCHEEGRCLIWQQGVTGSNVPVISLSAKQRSVSVRRLAYTLMHGPIPPGLFISPSCGNARCIGENCLQAATKSQYTRAASKRGAYSTPAVLAAKTQGIRATAKLLSMDKARDMRARREAGAKLTELAAHFGVSVDMASRVCSGKRWAEQVAAASVFGWRPAA